MNKNLPITLPEFPVKKMVFILLSFVALLSCCNKDSSSSSTASEMKEMNFDGYPVNLAELTEKQNFSTIDPSLLEVEQLKNNTLKITKYNGNDKNIIIPSSLYNLPVTSIGSGSFSKKSLTGIAMPNSIIEIEDSLDFAEGAFAYNDIVFLALSNNLAYIGTHAFRNNENLNAITIPNSTIVIENYAFASCNLSSVVLGSKLQYIGHGSFEFNKFLNSITLPSSLKSIDKEAFRYTLLNKLFVPNGITYIGEGAFPETITEIVIPSSLAKYDTKIGQGDILGFRGAFKDTQSLIRITLPANVDLKNFGTTSFGSFENSFVNFYKNQNRKAGTYVRNGPIWSLE